MILVNSGIGEYDLTLGKDDKEMDGNRYFKAQITEEEYSKLEPNNKRHYTKNYKDSPAIYQDGESEEELSLEFRLQDDE